ncbi:MAG: OmpA family protein [Sandaracinaceae bacterium]
MTRAAPTSIPFALSFAVLLAAPFAVLAVPLLAPSAASAQSVRLNQYRMAETPDDGFAMSRPNALGHLRFGARLDLDYALNPLVYQARGSDSGTERASVVEHQLSGTLGLSFGLFDRLVIYAGLPVNLLMEGVLVDGQPRADGASLGDVYFGLRGRLFGEDDEPFALSLQVTGTGPTAQAARFQSRFAGEGNWTIHPELLFEIRIAEIVRIIGNAGALVREEQDFGSLRVGHEFTWGGAVAVAVVPDLFDVTIETFGSTAFDRFGEGQVSPIEGLLGARVYPVEGLEVGLAGGVGLQRGYGSPDFRGVLSVGYATPGEVPAGDRDEDGLNDDVDECPDEPEDMDEFSDEDGCPDPDNDADGLLDGVDECPNEAEDRDGLGDEDGCPEIDFDGDGAADETDRCPMEPGVALAPRPECTGCPTCDDGPPPITPDPPPPVEQTTAPITSGFEARVQFNVGSDAIRGSELSALQSALAFAQSNPDAPLYVEGHADFVGAESDNAALSRQRARRVVRWLMRNGVALDRMTGAGCGERYPTSPEQTVEARRMNRRVEVTQGATIRSGCINARRE